MIGMCRWETLLIIREYFCFCDIKLHVSSTNQRSEFKSGFNAPTYVPTNNEPERGN